MGIEVAGSSLTADSGPELTDVEKSEPTQKSGWSVEPWSAPEYRFDAGDPGGK